MSTTRVRAVAALSGLSAAAALVALAAPANAATTTRAPSSTAAACDRTAWEAAVQGRPASFTAGARGGDYLWHDAHGFHLRVTHRGDHRAVYTGVITASAAMRLDPVRLERGDVVRLSADRRTLSFAFVDYGHIDGVDFHTDCAASLRVGRLHVGNANLPAWRVYLGSKERHPAAVPFTVHRRPAPATA
ncbi:MAG: hypothetical protein ACTHMS_07875 [Jatrophihabitans sp.]|uniref:hypothetical protein n=1 Tax=Jatrophihabitans sp. TaxID=1932789 RepID=UPI003F7E8306